MKGNCETRTPKTMTFELLVLYQKVRDCYAKHILLFVPRYISSTQQGK